MRSSERRRSTRQMIGAIEALDLGPIKFKLMDPQEGEGWTREFVERMETQFFPTKTGRFPMLRVAIRSIAAGVALWTMLVSTAAAQLRVPQEFPTIQAAIDAAPGGATFGVAPGTYRENLAIARSPPPGSPDGAALTVIDGGRTGPVVIASGNEIDSVTIQGFTITKGLNSFNGPGTGGPGGISLDSVIAVIRDNVIENNAGCFGAGIGARTAAATTRDNQIRNNTQDASCNGADGGGIFINGDGVTPSLIQNNTVSGHTIGGRGAGIAVQGTSNLTIRDNTISGNHADSAGGGAGGGILITSPARRSGTTRCRETRPNRAAPWRCSRSTTRTW